MEPHICHLQFNSFLVVSQKYKMGPHICPPNLTHPSSMIEIFKNGTIRYVPSNLTHPSTMKKI